MSRIEQTVPAGKQGLWLRRGRVLGIFPAGSPVRLALGPDDAFELADPPPGPDPAELEAIRAQRELIATDAAMARVIEDLVDVLIAKGVITEADLPDPARQKIDARRQLRQRLGGSI